MTSLRRSRPAIVERGADGGQRQIRRRDFWFRRRKVFRRHWRLAGEDLNRRRTQSLSRLCLALLSRRYLSDWPSVTSLQQSTPGARRAWRGWRSVSNSPARFLVPPSQESSVGSGVTLGGSVSVAAVLGVAIAAISVGLAVGNGPTAVNFPALVDRDADGGQRQIRWRDFGLCRRKVIPSEAASRSAGPPPSATLSLSRLCLASLSLRYLSDLPSVTGLRQSTPGARRLRRGWRSVSNSLARFLAPPSQVFPSEAA